MIVITGGDAKAFSAGADIKEMSDAEAIGRKSSLLEVVNAIEECRVPVVAAIGGLALGGGCEVITVAVKWQIRSRPLHGTVVCNADNRTY